MSQSLAVIFPSIKLIQGFIQLRLQLFLKWILFKLILINYVTELLLSCISIMH